MSRFALLVTSKMLFLKSLGRYRHDFQKETDSFFHAVNCFYVLIIEKKLYKSKNKFIFEKLTKLANFVKSYYSLN